MTALLDRALNSAASHEMLRTGRHQRIGMPAAVLLHRARLLFNCF
ncbi:MULTISPECIES: hypothetical protein [unclassified Xanthomonas]|nr:MULTISPECIES: hypothetical protein [unclassified Xanthomonas]MBB4130060.1 hypothetical protein [Xanthomonas sp. 3075]MBB5865249.1 hypothetical protein [Xanthomonas sp. 3058]